jgi:uncharacterized cupin superfamily protein
VERAAFGDADGRVVRLGDALGTEHVAANRYRLSPGDGFPGGPHAHSDQEEVSVVLAGAATTTSSRSRSARPATATRFVHG